MKPPVSRDKTKLTFQGHSSPERGKLSRKQTEVQNRMSSPQHLSFVNIQFFHKYKGNGTWGLLKLNPKSQPMIHFFFRLVYIHVLNSYCINS